MEWISRRSINCWWPSSPAGVDGAMSAFYRLSDVETDVELRHIGKVTALLHRSLS